jgi:hypothetical protein
MNRFLLGSCFLILVSCVNTKTSPIYQLGDDYYNFRQSGGKATKVYVTVDEDSVTVIPNNPNGLTLDHSKDLRFTKPSFDVDVLVTLFKYRPSTQGLPRQLTTDFSGNIYLGYRLDNFRVRYSNTPAGRIRKIQHKAISLGAFGGLGSTQVTPWTTNQGTMDEYNGLVLCRGIALMFGINRLTVGFGMGHDFLTDRDKDIWIYQNKQWYGLTLSINLN